MGYVTKTLSELISEGNYIMVYDDINSDRLLYIDVACHSLDDTSGALIKVSLIMNTSVVPTLNGVTDGLMSEDVEIAWAQLVRAAADQKHGRFDALFGFIDNGTAAVEISKTAVGVLESFISIKTLETALSLLDGVVQIVDILSEACLRLSCCLDH